MGKAANDIPILPIIYGNASEVIMIIELFLQKAEALLN